MCPTGNEYSDVRYGQSEQSYKQTDREMSGGIEPQIGGPMGPSSVGSYPRTFDRQEGREPEGPDYYPEDVYNHIPATGEAQWYTSTERQSVSGEYGQVDPNLTLGKYSSGDNIVPTPSPSKQFSSNKEGDPKKLVHQAVDSINAHSDLMNAYGLHQPVATMGSHPWLRDELTVTSVMEPGNAEPGPGMEVPERSKPR